MPRIDLLKVRVPFKGEFQPSFPSGTQCEWIRFRCEADKVQLSINELEKNTFEKNEPEIRLCKKYT
jgi:hypothetical protein